MDRLKLGHNRLSFSIKLRGEAIAYTARIGESPVVLKLGDIRAALNCDAAIRYDRQVRVLYLKPVVTSEGKNSGAVDLLLAGLLGGDEIPVSIRKIRPFIAQVGHDQLTVNMDIVDIHTSPEMLCMDIEPMVKKNRVHDDPISQSMTDR